MLKVVCLSLGVGILCAVPALSQDTHQSLGLQVSPDGVLMKDGKPFRGIGVNYFSLFYDLLKNPEDTGYREGLKALSDRGIPFVRFMGCGFWPSDNDLYFKDKEKYFGLMDKVIKAAEETKVGLIPSLFWCSSTAPDLVKEAVNQWGNPDSKTHAFMREYVKEMVTRYKSSPAIWAWEFGNEYPLSADLPNASEHRPAIVPELGTPSTRSSLDELTHRMVRTALKGFAEEVRKLDPQRAIITGNSLPRGSAWHQMAEGTWTSDSPKQFEEMILHDNPDPMNTLCIHVYGEEERLGKKNFPHEELLALIMNIAQKAKKPVFVGEFGAGADNGPDKEKEEFLKLLSAIEKNKVPLSALWVYNFPGQDEVWNVSPGNRRAYQLDAISEANKRMIDQK